MRLAHSSSMARLAILYPVVVLAVSAIAAAQSFSLHERAQEAGLTILHDANGTLGMEFMSAGGAVGDFNNDGLPDLFILGGVGADDCLYINNGDGTFSEEAEAWGVGARHRGVGVAVGDYNSGGWLDIYVTSHGPVFVAAPGYHRLYRNNGDGTFTDVAADAGVQWTSKNSAGAFSASFGDYDLDGDLDLAVSAWSNVDGNRLFQNNGDGTFTDVTEALNYDMSDVRAFSPRFTDMNGNGYPDLLWVADFFTSKYFINNGDGTFTEATQSAQVGLDSNGMGTTTGDFDNDGLLDWYVTSRINEAGTSGSGNMLYRNLGDHVYEEISVQTGSNHGWWGWGATAVDFNHDGWLDIAATNGFTGSFVDDPTRLFINDGAGSFTQSAEQVGLLHTDQGRGLFTFDYDLDGDEDLVITCFEGPVALYENQLSGSGANWLRIFFDTSADSGLAPNGFGTRVWVTTGDLVQMRYMDGGTNYLSQSELAVHFGLADASVIDLLRVEWANGHITEQTNVAVNQIMTLSPVADCPGDLDGDGMVGSSDLAALLGLWGGAEGDLNGDGVVNSADLAAMLGGWGPCL